ncbi:hypothetical protein [Niabella beijingensis]|uniref:hypothetical protein n=1 Tax=Niabella beijingensis TaxID=2872700 RepID=UPI001CBFBF1D|nr:hypothetical protein [Niabella beijingensis]MBZ4192080.1 hypothetical protein [Niabella beijingensis]
MSVTFYQAALVLHIIGITVMAGTSFTDFIAFRAFGKAYGGDTGKSWVLAHYLYTLQRFLGIGMLLILVSGITMMVKLHALWGAQLWFRIKMGILLLIIINGLGLRRILGTRLKKMIAEDNAQPDKNWSGLKRNFALVQLIQLLLFLIIYILSVFKFN